MSDNLIDTLDELIGLADPEGVNYGRLMKLRDSVARNVMIGPSARRFIQELVQRKDNIECRYLRSGGDCGVPGIQECAHTEWFRACHEYRPAYPSLRGDPLAAVGGSDERG